MRSQHCFEPFLRQTNHKSHESYVAWWSLAEWEVIVHIRMFKSHFFFLMSQISWALFCLLRNEYMVEREVLKCIRMSKNLPFFMMSQTLLEYSCRFNLEKTGFLGCMRNIQVSSRGTYTQNLNNGLFVGMELGCKAQVCDCSFLETFLASLSVC